MTPKRKFYKNGCQHIFQISVDKGIIFYTPADSIIFFTILSCIAIKYRVRITSCCIMLNHFHIQGYFRSAADMELFVNELTSIFALMYNRRYHRHGKLFRKSYGNAPKRSESDIDDNFIYISNNPVPKSAVEEAIAYRWNVLAYMDSDHPFSKEIDRLAISDEMRKGMSMVENRHSSGKYLDYKVLDRILKHLDADEEAQILDYIISVYNIIDYRRVINKWGSCQKLSEVLALVKGSEYDVSDDYSREDYRHYYQMNSIAAASGYDPRHCRFDTETLSLPELQMLRWKILRSIPASEKEIEKYLHLSRRVSQK